MSGNYRTAVCTALTGPDGIKICERPKTDPSPGQIGIEVCAAGLNFPDLLMTYGQYQFRPEPPFTPGLEFAGKVTALGQGVMDFALGDMVMSGAKGGAFAEYITVNADTARPLPAALNFAEGACWQTAAITAWHALHDKAQLQAGKYILVLGASGGVGMAAVKLAKHKNAVVIGVASTSDKRQAVLTAGADHVFDPADPDLIKHVKQLTSGNGVDVIFDPVGGDLAVAATRTIAWGGRYLIVGFASGDIPHFPANHALIKGYSLIGLRAGESARRDPKLALATDNALKRLAEQGVMRPHISHRFSLDNIADALRTLEQRQAIGRVAIEM